MLLDLGPVVGRNVSFFGEQLGCKIFVEDIYAELDRHASEDKLDALPEFLAPTAAAGRRQRRRHPVLGRLRLPESPGGPGAGDSADARPASGRRAADASSATAQSHDAPHYTKYIVVDETSLMYRRYPAARGRQTIVLSRDIIRLFEGLRVADSFLLQNNVRELLFRKPA